MKTIFVSSTFKDMHYERDIIHEKVTPALNDTARQYGESVSFCDLRWGVNTSELESEEGSRKVLSVCLDEIDRCRPYMIVILGERYGWIPGKELISDTAGRADFALDELEKSVTALEIEYGALTNPDQLSRTLFYFRSFEGEAPGIYRCEDACHAEKLRVLKERIVKITGGRVRDYTLRWDPEQNRPLGLEEFAAMVEHDVSALMADEWKETAALTPYQRDQRGQWDYAVQKARQFSAREDLIAEYVQTLEQGTNLLAIRGKNGCGKSTLMARLAQTLQEQNRDVLPIFCGSTMLCSDGLDLVKYIVDYLETRLDLPHFAAEERDQPPTMKEWTGRLDELAEAYKSGKKKRLVILIDAVDQLFDDENREKLRFIPHHLSAQVQMVLSCLDDFALSRRMETRQVQPLTEADRPAIISGILAFLGRELDSCVIDQIVRKPASDSPLYLSLILQRLTMMNKADFDDIVARGDGIGAITAHQIELVRSCSDTLDGVCVDILTAASERIGGTFVREAAQYLALSRRGLREQDLEGILTAQGIPWSALDYAQFVRYLSTFFLLRTDGRCDFAHQSIRRGILARCGDSRALHRRVLAHFLTLDPHDEVRMREFGYHCIQADEKQAFADYVQAFEEDDRIVSLAAKDAHDLSLRDGGAWLTDFLGHGTEYGAGRNLLRFINFELGDAFLSDQRELQLKRKILEAGLSLAQSLAGADPSAALQREYAVACGKLGNVYLALDGTEHLARAMELYQKQLERSEALARELNTPQSRRDLAVSCEKTGDIYQSLGGMENLQRAMELYQKDLALTQALADELGTAESRRDLSVCHGKIGGIYRELGGMENLRRALDHFQTSIDLDEALARELNTAQSRRDLSISYEKAGSIYKVMGRKEDLQSALEAYQKCLALREVLAQEQASVESRWDLAISYNNAGGVYKEMGGAKNLRQALELSQKGLALFEALAQELGTAAIRQELAFSYNRAGDLYRALIGYENLQRALAFYQKGLELTQALAQELGTAESRRELSVSYEKLGDIHEMLGGKENLQHTLEFYQKSLELAEALARELGTVSAYDDLAVSYCKVGRHRAVGKDERRHYLEQLLELSERLYQQTERQRYVQFISIARKALSKLPPDDSAPPKTTLKDRARAFLKGKPRGDK